MTRVLTPLRLEYLSGRNFRLFETFSVETDVAGRIDVPPGEPTDFNSIPRGLWNILPPTEYGEAATVHDELYRIGRVRGVEITRCIADQVHRELLIWAKAPPWKVFAFYWGLRTGGWATWNKYRAADNARAGASV